jgi:hypothetical protein
VNDAVQTGGWTVRPKVWTVQTSKRIVATQVRKARLEMRTLGT